jgi:excinuclease ABC subunit C
MNEHLIKQLSDLPVDPGVYLMKDKSGNILYVGKALDLKKRVSSYFRDAAARDSKTKALVGKIDRFDTIICGSENDAILLESNLIKRHRPRYNVILRDDKRYPSLRLDIQNPFPRLSVVRRIKKDGALYFGPFPASHAVRQTLKLIYRTFKIRRCQSAVLKQRIRPCINYQMGTCSGACAGLISEKDYREVVNELTLFLKGGARTLIQDLKTRMIKEAGAQNFEAAAALRDKAFTLEKALTKQTVVVPDFKDRDVLGMARVNEITGLTILFVRGGLLLGKRHFFLDDMQAEDQELIEAFIKQYYLKERFIPNEIFLPVSIEDRPLLEKWLSDEKGQKVLILTPQRGDKKRLVEMAADNAEHAVRTRKEASLNEVDFLERLRRRLRLSRVPKRIECFDLSNLAGSEPVGAMVVFSGLCADKSNYRRFRIKSAPGLDDYAMLCEVMQRRYAHCLDKSPLPDLVMVDGGKGQLSIAVNILKELDLYGRFDLIAITKKNKNRRETEDKIYKPGQKNPVAFGRDHDLLLFLQRVRDETHRFVITYHRKRRAIKQKKSILQTIPGVGEKRKKLLLSHLGSLARISKATVEDLLKVPGIDQKTAQQIVSVLGTGTK